MCGIVPDEYNKILACESANEIWHCLKIAHEETRQVKESKVDMLTMYYEAFTMNESDTIQ